MWHCACLRVPKGLTLTQPMQSQACSWPQYILRQTLLKRHGRRRPPYVVACASQILAKLLLAYGHTLVQRHSLGQQHRQPAQLGDVRAILEAHKAKVPILNWVFTIGTYTCKLGYADPSPIMLAETLHTVDIAAQSVTPSKNGRQCNVRTPKMAFYISFFYIIYL